MKEEKRIQYIPGIERIQKMEKDFDLNTERECFSCFYDLHLAAVCCNCSPDKFSCLQHAKILCSCDPDKKQVLLRYTIDELNTLVKALEECGDALKYWTSKHQGGTLDLNPSVKIENMEDSVYDVPDPEERISICVEPVNFGSPIYGKLWCNKDAIFPKGMYKFDTELEILRGILFRLFIILHRQDIKAA